MITTTESSDNRVLSSVVNPVMGGGAHEHGWLNHDGANGGPCSVGGTQEASGHHFVLRWLGSPRLDPRSRQQVPLGVRLGLTLDRRGTQGDAGLNDGRKN